ncbi:uncharacterized protein FA14DRAFT_172544 [Meira miltonrushii]|uniref:Uncharacterized protein n=1 Tax=Meira miltonrushii TaxID=1280837 RepID=A0A316VEE2_9BASI|nr:uncharacterized protein FA14DRAFT_172544 [Meira miltonrushii]PWN35952.1 hypothetical protein FA14DRAFT_172544 [Meira miltonrushii]
MYFVPPHSSTPRWMPDELTSYSNLSSSNSSGMDVCVEQGMNMLSSVRANKQRMISTIKRKRTEQEGAEIGSSSGSENEAYTNHYGYENTDASSFNSFAEQAKKARLHSPFHLHGIQKMGHPAPVHRSVMDDVEMDDDRRASSSSPTSESTGYGSSNDLHECMQPEQYLQLALSTPTGHPHPYSFMTQSASHAQSAPALVEPPQSRQELGAGYFDRVKY